LFFRGLVSGASGPSALDDDIEAVGIEDELDRAE
jgi:hypothetical protein